MAEKAEQKTIGEMVLQIVYKLRFVLLGILIAGVLGIAGVVAYSIIEEGARKKAANMLDAVDLKFDAYRQLGENEQNGFPPEPAEKEQAEKAVADAVEALVAAYPKRPAAQHALTLLAGLKADKEDFAGAEKDYLRTVELAPSGYLAAPALQNAAFMAERAGNLDAAARHLERVIADYKELPTGLARVYFSLGRIQEGRKAYDKAVESYGKMEELFPFDNWTNLGKSRIISLKSQGLVP